MLALETGTELTDTRSYPVVEIVTVDPASGRVVASFRVGSADEFVLPEWVFATGREVVTVSERRVVRWSLYGQELATLLRAGMPLVQSLDILRQRLPNPYFRAILDDVYERVRAGSSLSEAFEAQAIFPGVYTASLLAGEKSGGLEQVLRRYVSYSRMLAAVRRRTISVSV